jgi:hypothetical protein
MERLEEQGHLHPSIKHPETDMFLPGFEPPTVPLHQKWAVYQKAIGTAYWNIYTSISLNVASRKHV